MFLRNAEETKVYMVVNSHLDAGWLSTFDQYYTGQGTPFGESVNIIYNRVIPKLEQNSNFTYTISEVCFFARWWDEQTSSMRNRVKNLIDNKQLEFVNGGWVAHDEATTTYEDMLENLAQGSVWLKNNMDVEVDIGWQLDSFGTCSTHASLLAQAGYRMLFFSRLDFMDLQRRRNNQELEFIWRPPSPRNNSLLTHIFGSEYGIIPYLKRANNISKAFHASSLSESDYRDVETYINEESKVFRSNNFLMTIVGDFYVPANDYNGMQDLANHFNDKNDSNISLGFSTVAKFTDSLYRDLNFDTLPTKTNDFFPYIQDRDATWSGYYSSKPTFKALVRATSHYLNAIRSLYLKMSFNLENQNYRRLWSALTGLGQTVSLLQHHDAVTGTSKEKVRYDFEQRVMKAIQEVGIQIQPLLTDFIDMKYPVLNNTKNEEKTPIQSQGSLGEYTDEKSDKNLQLILDPISWAGHQLNDSKITNDFNIPLSFFEESSPEGLSFKIFSFNPGMAQERVISLNIPKKDAYNLKVQDSTGKIFSPDVFCLNIPQDTCFIRWIDQFSRFENKIYQIIKDPIVTLNPIAGKEVNFTFENSSYSLNQSQEIKIDNRTSLSILSDYQTLLLTNCDPNIFSPNSPNCYTEHILFKYMYYTSSHHSGAYVFEPTSNHTKASILNINGARIYQSKQFMILEIYNDKVTSQLIFQASSLNKMNGFEIITLVDGSIGDYSGHEIILSLKHLNITQFDEEAPQPFYVDTNGYFFAARTYGEKDDVNGTSSRNIPRNFYPMTTMMFINDAEKRMTIITDRAQGVTQIPSGEIEIMIHRITKADDKKGVGEPLDEKDPITNLLLNVTTRHFVLFTDPLDLNGQSILRSQAYEQPLQLWSFLDSQQSLSDFSFGVQLSVVSDVSRISEQVESNQDSNLKFLKMTVIDSHRGSVSIRLQNIHYSNALQFNFCDDNSILSSTFLQMLGSPSTSAIIGIATIIEKHLTNHRTLTSVSCSTPIQILPQELKTYQVIFDSVFVEKDSTGTSLWIWVLAVVPAALYLGCGIWLGRFVMSKNGSFGFTRPSKILGMYILFGLFWPCLFGAVALLRKRSRKDEKLLRNVDSQVNQEQFSAESHSC